MVSAIEAVGTLFYTTLKLDAQMQQLATGGIHDGMVPDTGEVAFPYVVIGEKIETPLNRLAGYGREVGVQIHIHSKYRGSLEAARMAGRVIYLLDQGQLRLSINGWIINSLQLEMNEEFSEDVDQRHRVIRFQVRVQPA